MNRQNSQPTLGLSPCRVLYDGMIFQRQAAGGINRYFESLIGHLPEHVQPMITTSTTRQQNFPEHNNLELYLRQFELPRPFRKVGRAVQAVRFRAVESQVAPDLVHATYYDMLGDSIRNVRSAPLVVTVHDMTHEKLPDLIDRHGKHAAMKRRAIEQADAIICVSRNTRKDLLEIYPHLKTRISVIHHATHLGDVEPLVSSDSHGDDRPSFLYVGSRTSYKNFDRLLLAMQQIVATHPDAQLRTVGSPFTRSEQQKLEAMGLADCVINHGLVSDSELSSLYRSSVALVYPSLYEGFGLPLIEAMSCDTAVIASDCSSIPEVVGEAGMLFNPHSTDSLVRCMNELLNDPNARADLITAGQQRRSQFSWNRAAEETLSVYERVMATSRIRIGSQFECLPDTLFSGAASFST